jgi:hypothetical protein
MYDFLVQDCMAFMPKLEAATIYFMKQITKAEKDVSVSGFLYSITWLMEIHNSEKAFSLVLIV